MYQLGTTGDFLLSALLAISQLIEPLPVDRAQELAKERTQAPICQQLEEQKALLEAENCSTLRDAPRRSPEGRRYREVCEPAEQMVGNLTQLCLSQSVDADVLTYRPKPFDQILQLSSNELLKELRLICFAVQDRAFLAREDWQNGLTSPRTQIRSLIPLITNPLFIENFARNIFEVREGLFDIGIAADFVSVLCDPEISIGALGQLVDITEHLPAFKALLDGLPRVNALPELPQANFVYQKGPHGQRGQRIGEIYEVEFTERNGQRLLKEVHRRRDVIPEQIPDQLLHAFVAIEDHRFFEHGGFDFEAIQRLIAGGASQGGSTFTMQLIKNAFFKDRVEFERAQGARTLKRKIEEVLMIPLVENNYSKKQILTYYLNLIDLTPRAQGLLMAALDLFAKSNLFDLTLDEMALLAALPKGTTMYNPIRNPQNALRRRNDVLFRMEELGYISFQERANAREMPLKLAEPLHVDHTRRQSFFYMGHLKNVFDRMRRESPEIAQASRPEARRLRRGGLDLVAPIDARLQEAVNEELQRGLLQFERTHPGGSRYQWTPWIDETTGRNMNIETRLDNHETRLSAVQSLRGRHPIPEAATRWLIAVKSPEHPNRWLIENGEQASVTGSDAAIYQRLRNWDAVLVEPRGNQYHLVGPSQVQGAVVIMDIHSGEVLALSGGFTAGDFGRFQQNNRATRSRRQPGSTSKVFSYAEGLNEGFQANTVLVNQSISVPPIQYCGNRWWSPTNYSAGGISHPSLRVALERSFNLPVVTHFLRLAGLDSNRLQASSELSRHLKQRLFQTYDVAAAFGAYPERHLLTPLQERGICLPFLLGGLETTVERMTQGFVAIANGGLRRDARVLNEVRQGSISLRTEDTELQRQLAQQFEEALELGFVVSPEAFGVVPRMDPRAVAVLRNILQGSLRSGTAARISPLAPFVGGKTGTTNRNRDAWFVGFTDKVAIGVWVGYDNSTGPTPFQRRYFTLGSGRTGGQVALPIFNNILERYYQLYPEHRNRPISLPTALPCVVQQGNEYLIDRSTSCNHKFERFR